mgnify:FL=1
MGIQSIFGFLFWHMEFPILSKRKSQKGGSNTAEFKDDLIEQLTCQTAFRLPILGDIDESVVVTWIIMAALVLLSIWLTHDLSADHPGKKQLALESFYCWIKGFFEDILGEKGKRYTNYMITVILYLGVSNMIGLLGFKPPTKDMNVTIALALMSILLIEYSGIHSRGVKGWLKSFAEPMPMIAPINVMEIFIRPVSLCMRLFGNILGGFVVMELIKGVIPVIVPIPFSLYFDVFDGLIQAYVFVFLTSLFIKEQVED